jgi:hypothetical protein
MSKRENVGRPVGSYVLEAIADAIERLNHIEFDVACLELYAQPFDVAVDGPVARSFLSFAKRYCGAYKNDYGWVTTGASNLEELNLLMKEAMLRRKKDAVLELPEKIRSWVPISVESAAARNAQRSFAEWFAGADASRPNDRDFLSRLTKLRLVLHKAKHRAVEERISDVVATDRKVIVFTAFTEGLKKHKAVFGDECVTISGADNVEQRMEAVDRFRTTRKCGSRPATSSPAGSASRSQPEPM